MRWDVPRLLAPREEKAWGMMGGWDGQALLEPISAALPCGQNLEETVLATLEIRRLFGQRYPFRPASAPAEAADKGKEQPRVLVPPDWQQVRTTALAGLEQSKDLRLLAYLGTAALWTDGAGLPAFVEVLTTAAYWLEHYWSEVYPRLDDDVIERRNALNCLVDPWAILDRVTYLPLADSRRHGQVTLAAIELLAKAAAGGNADLAAEAGVREAFAEVPLAELSRLERSAASGVAALNSIESRMRDAGGPEAAPDFERLLARFGKITHVLQQQLALRQAAPGEGNGEGLPAAVPSGPGEPSGGTPSGATSAAVFTGGAITSRQEAVRALDAVAEFFRRHEPSSPVPLFVERARRLVAKDFLEVLADVAPEALAGVRSAGGLKPDQ